MIFKDEKYNQIQEINEHDILILEEDDFYLNENYENQDLNTKKNNNFSSSKNSSLKEILMTPNEKSRSTIPSSLVETNIKNLFGKEINYDLFEENLNQ